MREGQGKGTFHNAYFITTSIQSSFINLFNLPYRNPGSRPILSEIPVPDVT